MTRYTAQRASTTIKSLQYCVIDSHDEECTRYYQTQVGADLAARELNAKWDASLAERIAEKERRRKQYELDQANRMGAKPQPQVDHPAYGLF